MKICLPQRGGRTVDEGGANHLTHSILEEEKRSSSIFPLLRLKHYLGRCQNVEWFFRNPLSPDQKNGFDSTEDANLLRRQETQQGKRATYAKKCVKLLSSRCIFSHTCCCTLKLGRFAYFFRKFVTEFNRKDFFILNWNCDINGL